MAEHAKTSLAGEDKKLCSRGFIWSTPPENGVSIGGAAFTVTTPSDPAGRYERITRSLSTLHALFAMGRPLFVLGILPFYALGLALTWAEARTLHWGWATTGLATVLTVQLMTHYANEFWDLPADRANLAPTRFSGGSRALVSGLARPGVALAAAAAAFATSALLAGYLFVGRGALATGLWALAAFIGWFYSAPPLRLEARGLGEGLIAVTSALLVPTLAYYLQRERLSLTLLASGLPLGLLVFALTLATELPDRAADAATGKATLPVRWGLSWGARLHDAALALAYGAALAGVLWGLPWPAGGLFWLTAPLAAAAATSKKTPSDPASLERLCLMDAALVSLGPLALAAGILVAAT